MQRYEKYFVTANKIDKIAFFCKNIWSIQKKAVPLHAFLREKHRSKPLAIALGSSE
jgi:hypothetical protein